MSNTVHSGQADERIIRSTTSCEIDFQQIQTAIQGIRFGEVRVIIQDGVIVQIERIEKKRLR
jgi:hypothetical protein